MGADHMEKARTLAEGVLARQISDWSCAHEALLVFMGLGAIDAAKRWVHVLHVLPDVKNLILTICELLECEEAANDAWLQKLCAIGTSEPIAQALFKLTSDSRRGISSELAYEVEGRVAEVAGKWKNDGRVVWLVTVDGEQRFRLTAVKEPWQRRLDRVGFDPRLEFPVTEERPFTSARDAASWLEEKLRANAGVKHEMYSRNPFRFDFDGWTLLRVFRESDLEDFPLLLGNWRIAADDPNFYSSNGTHFSYGMRTPYEEWLYHAVFCALKHRSFQLPARKS